MAFHVFRAGFLSTLKCSPTRIVRPGLIALFELGTRGNRRDLNATKLACGTLTAICPILLTSECLCGMNVSRGLGSVSYETDALSRLTQYRPSKGCNSGTRCDLKARTGPPAVTGIISMLARDLFCSGRRHLQARTGSFFYGSDCEDSDFWIR